MDFQDSFLFAEVLKYSYLIHSPVRTDEYPRYLPGKTLTCLSRTVFSRLNTTALIRMYSTRRLIRSRSLGHLSSYL
jgi:hypothetical protein